MEKVSVLLKAFVIGAGVLLLGGIVVLTASIVMRAADGEDPPLASRGPVDLALPAGARIEQVVPAEGRVLLLGVDAAGRQFLAVIDPETGQRLSLIRIRPDG